MIDGPTTLARLTCDEPTARRLANAFAEVLDPDDCASAAFEDDGGQWRVELYFRSSPDESALRALAADFADEDAAAALHFETLKAADWVAASLAGLKPVDAGRFMVHGAHDRARVPPNRIGIEIEAALAFGTGHHGTTRGCLLALDELAKRRRPRNVLDVGTGSGVLAIAAARALHCPVTAIDIDPQAVTTARGNADLNRAGPLIVFAHANGCAVRFVRERAPYDLIFANILLPPLKRMAAGLSRLAAPGGTIVLSGLLASHANAALSIYEAQGLQLEHRIALEGWVTLLLRKP
jgi:ribosomal protein L11 methyltransferase